MKTHAILIAALLLCSGARAQSLSMPDEPTAAPEATEQAQPEETVEIVEAEYNTPSKSYKNERNAIRRGNKLFETGNYHEALEEYNKALEVNSGSIRGRYNKAVVLMQLQSEDNKGTQNDPRVQAAQILQDLIADAKSYDTEIAEKSFYNLGNMAFNDEQYDRSIELYKNALRIDPSDMATRENLRLAQLKKQEQEQNQDQNQDKQDQKEQEQQQQQQQQQQQEQQDQHQQQQQEQPQPMTQSAQQILQSMQNKENQTRKKVKEQEVPAGRPQTDKPW